jgi:hypothetical protein
MMNIIFTLVNNLDWILSYFRGDNQKRKIGYPFGYLLYIYIYIYIKQIHLFYYVVPSSRRQNDTSQVMCWKGFWLVYGVTT